MTKKTAVNTKERWIIASNRLPYTYLSKSKKLAPSSGGLVSALSGVQTKADMHWVGSITSDIPKNKLDELEKSKKGNISFGPIQLDEKLYDSYYNGICNDVLWPLLHYESDLVSFNEHHWQSYIKVNEIFARKIVKVAKETDLIWVHDFHLFLLPLTLLEGTSFPFLFLDCFLSYFSSKSLHLSLYFII